MSIIVLQYTSKYFGISEALSRCAKTIHQYYNDMNVRHYATIPQVSLNGHPFSFVFVNGSDLVDSQGLVGDSLVAKARAMGFTPLPTGHESHRIFYDCMTKCWQELGLEEVTIFDEGGGSQTYERGTQWTNPPFFRQEVLNEIFPEFNENGKRYGANEIFVFLAPSEKLMN